MIKAYLNYPNYKASVHRDLNCSAIQANRKPGQRRYQINVNNISAELRKVKNKHNDYQFGAKADINDMWLEIDFQDQDFELAVLGYVHRVLGQRYEPFRKGRLDIHC